MSDLSLLVWLGQLGLSVAGPLAGFILLGVWLHDGLGWGSWIIWVGVILGISGAVGGLRDTIRTMNRLIKKRSPKEPPPVSFNDHN